MLAAQANAQVPAVVQNQVTSRTNLVFEDQVLQAANTYGGTGDYVFCVSDDHSARCLTGEQSSKDFCSEGSLINLFFPLDSLRTVVVAKTPNMRYCLNVGLWLL